MKVLVVGAGPAGAATALLLARYGLDVTLVEREESFERVFRGEGLMPLGIDALFEMGIGEVLESIPVRRVESWSIWIDGEEVFVISEPVEELGERAMRVVSQPALLERVVEKASRYPSFSFQKGARVHDLNRDAYGRVVGAELETEGGLREVRADLVVGCDGRGSLVRTRAGLELELLPEQYDVLWFKVPAPEALREGCTFTIMVATKKHPAVCYTSWDGRLQYGLVMPKGGLNELRGKDWLAESVGSAPAWLAEHVLAERDEIDGPIRLNVLVGRCREWNAPGVLLLGDAAHPMSPVRAQGINLALRDAVVAANHLVPVLRQGAEPSALDAACRGVQAEREPEIVRAQKLQRREAAGQGDARSGSWRFEFAKRAARLLGRYRWAQNAWLGRQHDLRFGSTEVRLRVSP
ncbi:MAG TPA: FAD-dependent oxidoreductase [Rubrobacteraceae bacterium]|nr:FAD-dependent oxidoreductase [Rubrobacteraceae bacterium]